MRDRFYLPLNLQPVEQYFVGCGAYASQFVEMLKGNNIHLDPTYPSLPSMIDHFVVRETPVTVKLEEGSYTFQTRVIESKEEIEGKKLRLILFSFYDHFDNEGNPWNPLTTDELSAASLEVIKAFQNHVSIHSMMTFSLGSLILDGLKHVSHDERELIPKTLILNRSLSSIWKVAAQLYSFPISYLLYQAVYSLGLDADPEKEIVSFFERMEGNQGSPIEGRKVVVIEAKNDRYFSGNGAFDPSLRESLESTGVEAYQGSFFVPLIADIAHHAIRLDLLFNNDDSGSVTSQFIPIEKNEKVPSSLMRNLMSETDDDGFHTLFIAGGNKDILDSITYLQAAPLMSVFIENAY